MNWEPEALWETWGDWVSAAITNAAMLMTSAPVPAMVAGSILVSNEGDNHPIRRVDACPKHRMYNDFRYAGDNRPRRPVDNGLKSRLIF